MKDQTVTLCQLALSSMLLFAAVSVIPTSLQAQAPAEEREKRIQEFGPEDLFPGMKERKKAASKTAVEPKDETLTPPAVDTAAPQKPPAAPTAMRATASTLSPVASPSPSPSPTPVQGKLSVTSITSGAPGGSAMTPAVGPSSMTTTGPIEAPKHKTSRWMFFLFLFGMALAGSMLLFLIAKLKEQIGETQFQPQIAAGPIEASPALTGEKRIRLSDKPMKTAKKMRRATNA